MDRARALENLYDPTRRMSRWLVAWVDLPLLDEVQRRDVMDWLDALPDDWWARFQHDDAADDELPL